MYMTPAIIITQHKRDAGQGLTESPQQIEGLALFICYYERRFTLSTVSMYLVDTTNTKHTR